jgi:hypothetical protein
MKIRFSLLVLCSFLLIACSNKSMVRFEELSKPLQKEGFAGAIHKVQEEKDDLYGDNTKFLYHFDLATLYHYNGDDKKSADEFEKAKQVYEDLYTKSVTNEAASVVTNDNVRPYRARPFEVLALYEMNIVNYLAMKDIDGALVESKAADIALQALYQKDNKKTNDAGYLRYLIALVYEMEGERDNAAIAYYKTAKAYEEEGTKLPAEAQAFIVNTLEKEGRGDDVKSLKLPNANAPMALPNAVDQEQGEIVVIGYAGHSAILGEWMLSGTYVRGGVLNVMGKNPQTGRVQSLTIPFPATAVGSHGGTTVSVTIAVPERKDVPYRVDNFEISVNEKRHSVRPEVYLDNTEHLIKNLDDERATTLGRTAVRVLTRTIAAQQAKKAMETNNIFLNLLTSIGTDVAAGQLEQADLRVAIFLPHVVRVARIPAKPGTHTVKVIATDRNGSAVKNYTYTVNVKARGKAVVVVPAIR